ncbi:MAG TPA: dienelactone hydrolase family protein [Thermoanaerobaculia bacterium]
MRELLFALLAVLLGAAYLSADEKGDLERMAAQHQHDKPVASPATTPEPAQPVSGEEVTYGEVAGHPVKGYLAKPKSAHGPLPAVILVHEWWGLNDNIRAMARRLAGEGYTALAVDLYGGAVAKTPDEATKLMQASMQHKDALAENLRHAQAYLKRNGAPKIGVVGWCFGGGWSLQTALLVPDGIDAAVVYYGRPEPDKAEIAKLKAPVLGLYGADDQGIPVASVRAFEATAKELGKNVEIHVYDGAGHAFANPSGTAYRPEAAKDAWSRTTAFFKQHLQGGA